MAMTATQPRPRRRRLRFGSLLLRLIAVMLVLVLLASGGLWVFGPVLIRPVDYFAQGPGAAIAYVSLARQMASQAPEFWAGQEIQLVVNEDEFSGMLASALLSGRQPGNPVRRVRSTLSRGSIAVDSVLLLTDPRIPERFQGEVGLRLWLRPTVTKSGQVDFAIIRAAVGRIPVPVALIRWAGQYLPVSTPGFDARQAVISLPVSQMVTAQFGRNVKLKQFSVTDQELTLMLVMPKKAQ